MASRKDQARTNLIVGVFVFVAGFLLLLSLFIIATSEGLLEAKTQLHADFRSVTGLSKNSPVQLGGMKIGVVKEIHFTTPAYPCNPTTEDYGRGTDGRTDDCEMTLLCAPEARCAELMSYTGQPGDYQLCSDENVCGEGEVCVTSEFRKRYRRVKWLGPSGICVPYSVDHRRVSVTMEIAEDKLVYIRQDSRASISANGVLGDQLIAITVGSGEPIEPGGYVQTTPSIMEELYYFKDRLDTIVDNVDRSLSGVAGLFDSLNDDRTKKDIKGILANSNEISRQVAEGEGLVGAMFNDPEYKEEFGQTMRHVRHGVSELDQAVTQISRDVKPSVRKVNRTLDNVNKTLDTVNDPNNQALVSRLIHDEELGEDVAVAVKDASETLNAAKGAVTDIQVMVAEVRHSISTGEGTLGKLIKDPKAYDDLVKVLGNIERNNVIKKLVRFVVEQDEASSSARPDSSIAGAETGP